MSRVILFDVNETLLDLAAVDPMFGAIFGDGTVRREWFGQMLQSAMTATLAGVDADCRAVGGAALTMVGERRGVAIDAEMRQQVSEGMRRLPPHNKVPGALDRCERQGSALPH